MGIFNVFIDKNKKEAVIENRRRPEKSVDAQRVVDRLNSEDERPHKIEVKPLIVEKKEKDASIARESESR